MQRQSRVQVSTAVAAVQTVAPELCSWRAVAQAAAARGLYLHLGRLLQAGRPDLAVRRCGDGHRAAIRRARNTAPLVAIWGAGAMLDSTQAL